MNRFISTLAVLAVAPASLAQIVVDGTADKVYGDALAVQNVQTQFGNATSGQIDIAIGGSEIDGIFARVEGGVLYLVIAGNLESNFNKLEVFFDTREGGQNRLRGDNPDVDFNGLNRMGDDGSGNGLTFDECFTADFYFTMTNGFANQAWSTFATIAQVLTDGGGIGAFVGTGGAGANILNDPIYGIQMGFNNSNVAGVDGGTGPADGSGVRTGVEIALPLNLIGVDPVSPQNIKICAFVNGQGHDFASNQFIAGLGPDNGNLGEPRFVNLAAIPGNQYVVVELVPGQPDCPGSNDCPADLDGDGIVGGTDLTTLLAGWGTASADIDGDGNTSGTDLTTMLAAWGPCS